jgi:hypothetical protein
MRTAPVILASVFLIFTPASSGPGSLLQPGMQLIYSSNDQDIAPWYIDSVRRDSTLRPGSACTVIHQRRQAAPGELRLCLANDTLFGWSAERNEWRPQRPVGPHMVMRFSRANGIELHYATTELGEEQIDGRTIPVVLTTVTTSDSAGRPMRRLRERYAIGLATATGGEFEVPDSTAVDGWRTEQQFTLREIRYP